MTRKWILPVALMTLLLAACSNPVETLQEQAAEQVAETILEEATGIEDLEFDTDGETVSYSVDDGEGNQMDVTVNETADVDAIEGMGFSIAVPDEMVNGTIQRMDENGEEMMVNATFEVVGMTRAELYEAMHASLTAEGFTYLDPSDSGQTQPDPEGFQMIIAYQHPDGYQFTMMGDETTMIMGLIRTDAGETEAVSAEGEPIATELDGSMSLDREQVAAGEPIVVTLVINSTLADDAWVGIVPSSTPHGSESDSDAADLTYEYVRNAVDGQVTLNAPSAAGSYDVRLFNTDSSDGVELASVTVTVTQ